jgi:hypothetical protein
VQLQFVSLLQPPMPRAVSFHVRLPPILPLDSSLLPYAAAIRFFFVTSRRLFFLHSPRSISALFGFVDEAGLTEAIGHIFITQVS